MKIGVTEGSQILPNTFAVGGLEAETDGTGTYLPIYS
jgi:hypothetical protein